VDPRHLLAVEAFAHHYRGLVADPHPGESDALHDHVVGGDEQFGKAAATKALPDLEHPCMIGIPLRRQGEEETRIDEDHL
jgi:hypothetical protein